MIDETLRLKLQKKYGTEQVYVIPFIRGIKVPDKYSAPCLLSDVTKLDGFFSFRYDAEYNMTLLQVIPYILVLNKHHDRIYVTERIAGEERLQGKLSLGCGGHINPCDTGNLIMNAAKRELNEELNIVQTKNTDLKTIGTVRDIRSKTSDHIGLVMIATASRVSVKEKNKMRGFWFDFNALILNYNKFESWARHIIDAMFMQGGKINSLLNR